MKVRSWVSLLASVAVFCMSVPLTSLAAEKTEAVDLTLSGLFSEQTLQEKGHVGLTDTFLENLYTVEYENENDTRTVYSFSSPVKYRTDDGEVAYIDTSLETTNFIEKLQGYAYKNETNAFDLYFPKKSTGDVLTKCSQFSIKQRICGLEDETAASGKTASSRTVKYAVEDEGNEPEYTYEPTATGCRGQVNFSELPEDGVVQVALSGEDIASIVCEEETVQVYTQDGTALTLWSEGVTDADGNLLQSGDTSFVQKGNTYVVSFAVDTEAMPEDVSYPLTFAYHSEVNTEQIYENEAVTVSGAATYNARTASNVTNSACAIQDTMVVEANPNNNYSTTTVLFLSGGAGNTRRIYTKFDLSVLSGVVDYNRVISACYSIYQNFSYTNYETYVKENFDIELHQVSESYDVSTVTWNTKPDYYETMIAGDSIVPDDTNNNNELIRYYFMLTSLVQGWLQGLDNNGIVICMRDETETTTFPRKFPSSIFTNEVGPYFTVTYTTDTTSLANVGIEDNAEYYIKCKGSVMGTSGATTPQYITAPSSSGGYVTLQPFAASSAQKWKVVPAGNGYYYLRPANLTSYVLYTTGTSLSHYYGTKLSVQEDVAHKKFRFLRNWDGSYHIVSAVSNNAGLWTSQAATGQYVRHGMLSVDMDFLDDWTLEKVSKGSANLYCFDFNAVGYQKSADGKGGLNTYTYAIEEAILSNEYQFPGYVYSIADMQYNSAIRKNNSAASAVSTINSSDLWLFSGHGGAGSMLFGTTSSSSTFVVSPEQETGSVVALNSGRTIGDLSSLRLFMANSCNTGIDNTNSSEVYNMVGQTYYFGAHLSIAFTNITDTGSDVWQQGVFKKCSEGMTIGEAIEYMDELFREHRDSSILYSRLYNRHIVGDTAMRLDL